MRTWTELLDEYEASIRSLEEAAVSGEPPVASAWDPPTSPPQELPTTAELGRFRSLRERGEGSAARARAALADAAAAVGDLERTGVAARAYGRAEYLIPGGPRDG